jgi:hypothetical protein
VKKFLNIFLAMMFCVSNLFSMDRFFLKASCDSASDSSSAESLDSSSSKHNVSSSNASSSVSGFSSNEPIDLVDYEAKKREMEKEAWFEEKLNRFKQFVKENPNVKIDPVSVRCYFGIWNRSLPFEKEALERTDPISCKLIELIDLMPKKGVYDLDELIKILLKCLDVSCN